LAAPDTTFSVDRSPVDRIPYAACALVGMGGLFAGVTGPLVSTFLPPLVQSVLGNRPTTIGIVMAIDNVLLLLLVPLAGAASDQLSARGRGRLPIVLPALVVAALGMALLPESPRAGIVGVLGAMVVLFTGINVQRSPFQSLVADLVPSRYRSIASGSVTFQMCAGAIVFLMLGQALGMQTAYRIAALTVLALAGAAAVWLREPAMPAGGAVAPTVPSLIGAARSAVRGDVRGLRAIFGAALLLQLTFQTFTTWYALHGTERFNVRPEDVTIGFIAWAVGGVIGALPAGIIGARIGRRPTMLAGFALLGAALLALDRVTTAAQATPLIALASAAWTLPMANAYPLFIEPVPRRHRGILAALFLLCIALGGAIGDPLNGVLFGLYGSYRPMFLVMAVYSALAFAVVLLIPRGTGEADTGLDGAVSGGVSVAYQRQER
jgi:maltose/moltooligosaccharide transporter